MRQHPLIIPIAAQALVVPKENLIKKVDLKNRLDSGENILGEEIQFDLENCFNEPSHFRKGIHIHWNIPKALKHGITQENDSIDFPAVPNRWLVVRISMQDDTALKYKSWIVQSDVIDDEANPNYAQLNEAASKIEYIKIGKKSPAIENISEGAIKKLTALSPINPYFSNIFDECEDVFGIHDDMTDSHGDEIVFDQHARFTYMILGCFDDEKYDPLAHNDLDSLRGFITNTWYNNDNQTKLDFTKYDGSFFHTNIFDVKWEENTKGGVHQGTVHIAVGNNTAEAWSALLVNLQKNNTPESIEDYITALQNKLMDDTSELGMSDLNLFRLENHSKTFTPKQNEFLWELKNIDQQKSMPDVQKGITRHDPIKETPYFPDDQVLVDQLKALNEDQGLLNRKSAELKSLQQLYYFKWYQNVKENKLIKKHDALLGNIEEIKSQLNTLAQSIAGQASNINQYLQQKFVKPDPTDNTNQPIYELIKISDEPYWEPNDPTVLFHGDGLGDVNHFHLDITDRLPCRQLTEILPALSVTFNNAAQEDETIRIEGSEINLSGLDLGTNSIFSNDAVPLLIREAILLSGNFYTYLRKFRQDQNINLTQDQIIRAQKAVIQNNLKLVKPGHQQAWEPLFLLWKVIFKTKHSDTKQITCQGFTPITPGARQSIMEYSESTASKYNKMLGQALSGFNKQLLAQLPSLQLPPVDYKHDALEMVTSLDTIDHDLINIIGQDGAYQLAPALHEGTSDAFNPLRQGVLEMINLSLIDTFGQIKTLENIQNPSEMFVSSAFSPNGQKIIPAPRIIQPSRLLWNWINPQNKKIYQDSAAVDHPIIGWIVPGFMEKQLLIYNEAGQEIMGLRYSELSQKMEEFYPLDAEINIEDLEQQRKSKINDTLRKVMDSLDVKSFLDQCENVKNLHDGSGHIQEYNPVHLLYGKPIAIARATLILETLGPVLHNPQNQFDNSYLSSFTMPVSLVNIENNNSGLVGYFLDNDYNNFTFADGKQKPIDININNPISLTIMVMSGTSFVLDSAGWLPYKSINLFSNTVDELTKDLNIRFLVSPVLSGVNEKQMITPNFGSNDWEWMHRSNVTTWQKPESIQAHNQENHHFAPVHVKEGWIRMQYLTQHKNN